MPRLRWLITGASGQLGSHVVRQLRDAGRATLLALAGQHDIGTDGVDVQRIDLGDLDTLKATVTAFRPTQILHLGAMTAVAECYARPAAAEQVNVQATRVLAEVAARCGARLVFSSTDMVFDGQSAPYAESDPPRPVSRYGDTKAAAERFLAQVPTALVVRLPLLYGLPYARRKSTFASQVAALRAREPLRLFADEFRTPIWLGDAARALIGLAQSELGGLIHVAGPQRLSRYELVAGAANLLGIRQPNLIPVSRLESAAAEPRPADLSLVGTRFNALFPHLAPGPLRAAALRDN